MDDPIFDPWCLADESWQTPPQRTSRWRSASGSTSQGVPASRPVPSPIVPIADDVDGKPTFAPGPIGERAGEPDRPPAREAVVEPTSDPGLAELPPLDGQPTQTGIDGTAAFLRALLVPPIETLSRRLIMAGHRTTVDDRLGQRPAALRFRIEPWQGPFDETAGRRGAVLEVTLEDARAARVAGRLWLDPLSKSPTEQTSVKVENVTSTWIDRLLLDFVEKALKQG